MAKLSWVLLVEDDADHRVLVKEALRRVVPSVAVTEMGNAPDAMRWLGEHATSSAASAGGLVILDLGLPGPSGFDLLEWMRGRAHLGAVPVVVLTASENPLDAEHAFNLGVRGYFEKPTDFQRYVGIFERVFNIAAGSDGGQGVPDRGSR